MRYALLCLSAALCAAACGGPAARAVILQPADGDTVGTDVLVVLGAEGVEVVPADGQQVAGRGHHHLFVDTDPSMPGTPIPAGATGIVHLGTGAREWTVTGLTPGEHRIIAILAYGNHVPMENVGTDTVRVIVRE